MPDDPQVIYLPLRLSRMMRKHVRSVLPEEACGFLAGVGSTARAVLPVTNELHSPVRFRMQPVEEYRAMQWMDEVGLDILAIYHSHPLGPPQSSATDLAEHMFPDTFCMIWYPAGTRWRLGCFRMKPGQFEELSIYSGVKKVKPGE